MPPIFTARECIKAARSAAQNSCVRIGRKNGWTVIWDDKLAAPGTDVTAALPSDQTLMFTDEQFDAFQEALRAGGTADGQCVQIDRSPTGRYTFTARSTCALPGQQSVLYFDSEEFEAFLDGVRKHEFELTQFGVAAPGESNMATVGFDTR